MNKKSVRFGSSLTLLIAFLAGCATGDFSRMRPVAPPAAYTREEVAYENRWVNGINFIIAKAGDMQVAAAMWPDQLRALIVLVNGSNTPVTFLPQEIVAEAIQTGSTETQRSFLGTYSAEEYEKKARPAQGWDTTMSILAARDYPAVSAMIQDKMREKSAAFQAMTTTLMHTHTLAPQSYYGGRCTSRTTKRNNTSCMSLLAPKVLRFSLIFKYWLAIM